MSADEKPRASTATPEVGKVARDTARQRVGVVLAIDGSRARLRSLSSGETWEADLEVVRGLSAREELSARVAVVNAATRWGGR